MKRRALRAFSPFFLLKRVFGNVLFFLLMMGGLRWQCLLSCVGGPRADCTVPSCPVSLYLPWEREVERVGFLYI